VLEGWATQSPPITRILLATERSRRRKKREKQQLVHYKILVVTVPSCIRPSKKLPPQKELHQNCEMPPCGHTGVALREGGLSPTSPPLIPNYLAGKYGFALAELNSALIPCLSRWCVRKSYWQVDPLAFRPRWAHVLHTQVKPKHLGPKNRKSRDTLRSAPPTPIPDRLFRAHPRQSTQNAFSCQFFYPTHAKNHYCHPNTCIVKLSVYIRLYTYSSSRTIKDRVIKVGTARFINMHNK
jgi:hypothetical protein